MAVSVAKEWLGEGFELAVKYDVGENLWHRRLLLRETTSETLEDAMQVKSAGGPVWWIATGDRDVYPEELSLKTLKGIIPINRDGALLKDEGVGDTSYSRQVHGSFRDLAPRDLLEMVRHCRESDEVSIPRETSIAANGEVPKATETFTIGRLPDGLGRWVVVRSSNGERVGEDLTCEGRYIIVGRLGLMVSNKVCYLVADVIEDEIAVDKKPRDLDARVLEVSRDASGLRHKDFRSALEELTTSEWSGWPLTGPRTARWCLQYILDTDGAPRSRHTRWKRDANLGASDPGVMEHELILRAVEHAIVFDQINITEMACFELLLRRAQLTEFKHREAMLRSEGGDEEDSFLYLGVSSTRGQVMMCPELEEFVSSQLQREGSVMKERRKLTEERELVRQRGRGRGRGGGTPGPAEKREES